MVPPLLKLTFIKGPIQGESREYKPGSTIRVGRVVRGNEITIKDGGISTKHLKIVSDSENWIIQDLGSSNGTTLNLEDLDPDTPLNLSHGDVIRLGGDTIIEVYFVTNVQPPETSKLPPRPRRNKRRLDVSDPEVEPVQEAPKRTRAATRSKTVADVGDEENETKKVKKEDEVPVEKKVNPRAGRGKKKNIESDENPIESVLEVPKRTDIADNEMESEVVTRVTRSQRNQKKVEEAPVVEKENSRVQRCKKNENLGLKSVKLEVESTLMGVAIPPVKRATRSKQIGNACLGLQTVKSEDITLEEKDEVGVSRATRSRRKEIGGDSYMELDKVLKQARKKKKVMEQKPPEVEEMKVGNDEDTEEERENEKDNSVEQVEIEPEKREDGEAEKSEEMGLLEEECPDADCKNEEAGSETLQKVEQTLSEREEVEARNDVMENEEEIEGYSERCDEEDVEDETDPKVPEVGNDEDVEEDRENEKGNSVEQVEIESEKREDGKAEKLQEMGLLEEECPDADYKNEKAGSETLQKVGQNLSEREEVEAKNDAEAGLENEEEIEGCSERCDEEDELSNRVEQVELEFEKSSTLEEDLGLLQNEFQDSERDCKSEEKQSTSVETEARNDGDVEKEKENRDEKVFSDEKCETGVEKLKRLKQAEIESKKCSLREDGETENLQKIGSLEEERENEKDNSVEEVEIESEKREDGEAEKLQEMGLLEVECPDADCKNDEAGSETLEKVEQKLSESKGMEARNDVEAGTENEEEIEGRSERCDEEAELSNRAEQVEIEFEKSSTLEEDGGTEKLEGLGLLQNEFQDSERDCKSEEEQSKSVEIEARNDVDVEKEKENGDQKVCSDDKCYTGDEKLKRVEQVENELETVNLQEIGSVEEECHDCKSGEMEVRNDDDVEEDEKGCNDEKIDYEDEFPQRVETSEKVEEERSSKKVDKVKIDLEKMTLGEFFDYLEVHLPRQIIRETDEMIEVMRSRALRVQKHIAEQKKAMGKM